MKWWQKLVLVFSIISLIAFVASYLAMYVSPEKFWPLAFFGLAYFPILIIYLLFCIFWFFVRRKIFYVFLVFFILGFKAHIGYFSFNIFNSKAAETQAPEYKILQYNVKGFNAYNLKGKYWHRDEMIENIGQEKPDFVCIEEFNTYHDNPREKSNLDELVKATGLKYKFYYKAYQNQKFTRSFGLLFLSKYPVIDTGVLNYMSLSKLNSTIYADVKINTDTIRFFMSHLQSTQLSHSDFEFIEADDKNKTNFDADRVASKLKMGYALRAEQADSVKQNIKRSPYPVVVCGDFNDTPVSYAYRQIADGLQDAFTQKGFGIGATYVPFPVIRIDYMLFDENKFTITDYHALNSKDSDHYPCVTTFSITKN